jgi:hypothetical protein
MKIDPEKCSLNYMIIKLPLLNSSQSSMDTTNPIKKENLSKEEKDPIISLYKKMVSNTLIWINSLVTPPKELLKCNIK